MSNKGIKIYFSDYFNVNHKKIEKFGALDISLVCDNPAFVDPFLIFANPQYKDQHEFVIQYLQFLRDKARSTKGDSLNGGDFLHYYKFPEVKEAWLGYSVDGNAGLGLGRGFAESLYDNLVKIFSDFGNEKVTSSAHIEKLCLIEKGIGVDKISDFTLNLIKQYLLEYTQEFCVKNINKRLLKEFAIKKVAFNFSKEIWEDGRFLLPYIERNGKVEFVLLVPRNLLTRSDTWISGNDFLNNRSDIFSVVENAELRAKLNKFFEDHLQIKLNKRKKPVKDYSSKSKNQAFLKTVREYPVVLDYYIREREQKKDEALKLHVADPEIVNFYSDTTGYIQKQFLTKKFGRIRSVDDCLKRLIFFKRVLESNSKSLYIKDAQLQEKQLQLMFKMVTFESLFDYNSEVNNGHGPIDFMVSMGADDKIGLEFKLASSSKLKQNLQNQGKVYQEDSNLKHVIKIIFFFSDSELERVRDILSMLKKKEDNREIFLIDCRKKESASNQK